VTSFCVMEKIIIFQDVRVNKNLIVFFGFNV
jgi:hypothetical protein